MDYAKVDAALTMALSRISDHSAPRLQVSLRTTAPLNGSQCQDLRQHGLLGVEPGRIVVRGELSPSAISALTEKPFIRLISLAQTLQPLR